MKRFPRLNLKNINRLFMLAVVFAPIFYLFGSLFTTLNGAHQNDLSASHSYEVEEGISFAQSSSTSYSSSTTESGFSTTTYVLGNIPHDTIAIGHYYAVSLSFNLDYTSYSGYIRVRYPFVTSAVSVTNGHADMCFFANADSSLFMLQLVFDSGITHFVSSYQITNIQLIDLSSAFPSSSNSERQSLYSSYLSNSVYSRGTHYLSHSVTKEGDIFDYLQSNFFTEDNYLVQMGKDSLSADPNGFAPANSLVQLLDETIFHYGEENQIACMAYGYAVWVFNAVVLDMVIVLALKLTLLPLRAVEIFEKGEKE